MPNLTPRPKRRFVLYRKGSDTGLWLLGLGVCGIIAWANWDSGIPHWYWLAIVAGALACGKVANMIAARWPQNGAGALSVVGGSKAGIASAPASPSEIPACRNSRLLR